MERIALKLRYGDFNIEHESSLRKKAEHLYSRMSEEDKTSLIGYHITTGLFPPAIVKVGEDMADADLFDVDGNTGGVINNQISYFHRYLSYNRIFQCTFQWHCHVSVRFSRNKLFSDSNVLYVFWNSGFFVLSSKYCLSQSDAYLQGYVSNKNPNCPYDKQRLEMIEVRAKVPKNLCPSFFRCAKPIYTRFFFLLRTKSSVDWIYFAQNSKIHPSHLQDESQLPTLLICRILHCLKNTG